MSINIDKMDRNDAGGVGAKEGFLYQDYAAAFFVTNMLLDKRLKAVRCEVTDDIDLIYNDYIEFVQVKGTEVKGKWGVALLTKKIKKTPVSEGESILQKSLSLDRYDAKSRFRIITKYETNSQLSYLRLPIDHRKSCKEEDDLITSLTTKLNDIKSPQKNGIDYWVRNTFWDVQYSKDDLRRQAVENISKAAASEGVMLNPLRDTEIILNNILSTVTKLSSVSRKINMSSDKTYTRVDLIDWFKNEISIISDDSKHYSKVYPRKRKDISVIFLDLLSLSRYNNDFMIGFGIYQGYHQNKYRFKYIAARLKDWLPEVLLRPDELANLDGLNLINGISVFNKRMAQESNYIEALITRTMLHSLIRTKLLSQPIPAHLYKEKLGGCEFFDNVHIVIKNDGPDEIWMGLNYLLDDNDISGSIKKISSKLDSLLSDEFDKQREIILDIKLDSYLFKHDVDEILQNSVSLDLCKDRFRFVIFLGYKTEIQTIDFIGEFEEDLKKEVLAKFNELMDGIIKSNSYFEELKFSVYLYPIPNVGMLVETFKELNLEN